MDAEERKHTTDLLQTTQQRLRVLEQQKAKYGLSVPPHIVVEIEEAKQEIRQLRTQLGSSAEPVKPLPLRTAPLSLEAQIVLKAAKTWGTTLKGWLSKLYLLDPQERLSVLQTIINSPEDKQATAYMFAALSNELPQEEIAAIVNEMVRRVIFSEDFEYKAMFMSAVPIDALRLAPNSLLESLFTDIIDTMNRDQFGEVNLITPAAINIQGAIPESMKEDYVKALMQQAISGAYSGGPAARKAAVVLPDDWAVIGLQELDVRKLLVIPTGPMEKKFYKQFVQKYTALWPEEKRELFQDYLTLSSPEMDKKYLRADDDDDEEESLL